MLLYEYNNLYSVLVFLENSLGFYFNFNFFKY